MTRGAALFTLCFAACFNPTFDNPTCGPNGECPSGFTCEQSVCREMVTDLDAPGGGDAIDSAIDAPIDAPGDGAPNDGNVDAPMCPVGEITSPASPNRCFFKLNQNASWQNARVMCQGQGGDLANILTQPENNALAPFYMGENQGLWLGGTDMMIEMDWRWISDPASLPPYFQWAVGEPNDQPAPGDCMRMDQGGNWFDTFCNETRRSICVRTI